MDAEGRNASALRAWQSRPNQGTRWVRSTADRCIEQLECRTLLSNAAIQIIDQTADISAIDDTVENLTTQAPSAPDLIAASDTGRSNSDNVTKLNNSTGKSLQFVVGGTITGATVTLYALGVPIGSALAVGSSVTITSNGVTTLPDGNVNITARQTVGGVQSSDSPSLTIRIDSIAPARPSAPDLQDASDSGISSSDNITNSRLPIFNITSTESELLHLTYSGGPDTTLSVSSAGKYSLTPTAGMFSFSTPQTFAATEPGQLESADFNGDNASDILMNFGVSDVLGIMFNNGDGTFAAPVNTKIGGANDFVISDFDHDGKADVVLSSTSSVRIVIGNGDGTFRSPQSITDTPYAWTVTAQDFNNDGNQDVAVDFYYPTGKVQVYLGNGDGTFQAPISTDIVAARSQAYYLESGDFNRDGKADLIVAKDATGFVVMLGNGDGTFQTGQSISNNLASDLVTGDFNNDTITDLVGIRSNSLYFYSGNGDGSFQSPVIYTSNDLLNARAPQISDFNHDGNLDIALNAGESTFGYYVAVTLGKGDGTFVPSNTSFPIGTSATGLVAADFDHDGTADIASTSYYAPNISIALTRPGFLTDGFYDVRVWGEDQAGNASLMSNALRVTFDRVAPTKPVLPDLSSESDSGLFNFDDVTNRSRPLIDVTATEQGVLHLERDGSNSGDPALTVGTAGTYPFIVGANDPFKMVAQAVITSGSQPYSILTADLNGDSASDLIVCNSSGGTLRIVLNSGNGTFLAPTNVTIPFNAFKATAADFNNDGNLDIAYSDYSSHIVLLPGNGNGTFQASITVVTGAAPRGLSSADFNNDKKADLAVSYANGKVSVFTGNGDGTFQPPKTITVASGTVAGFIPVADFDRDGNADLALITALNNTVTILLGNGDATFRVPLGSLSAYNVTGITTGDFNNDRIPDVAATAQSSPYNGDNANIFLGRGDGTFQSPFILNYGISNGTTSDAVAADFNGDGRLDFATTLNINIPGNRLAISLGNGDGTIQAPLTYAVGNNPSGLCSSDFNRDGFPDVAVVSITNTSVYPFFARGLAPLPDGVHTFRAWAEDVAGNKSQFSSPLSVRIDTVPPTATITPITSPRTTSFDSLSIGFNEPVYNLTLGKLSFTRNGSANLLSGAQTLSTSDNITWTLAGLSALTNFVGTYTLSFVGVGSGVTDAAGNEDANTATLNVTRSNTAPTFTPGANQVSLEDGGAQTVLNWATNIDAGESGQTLNFIVSNNNNALFSVQPAIAPDGTLTYTAAANASGVATVKVKLHDDGGGDDTSAEQSFTITITAVADAPTLNAPPASGNEGSNIPLAISSALVDTDGSESLSIQISNLPTGATLSAGVNNSGVWTLTPADLAALKIHVLDNGSFTLKVKATATESSNGDSASTSADLALTVNNVAPTPTISGAPATSPEGTLISLTGSATDPGVLDTYTLAWTVTKNNAFYASGTGSNFNFAPDDNGSYRVTLTATDNNGDSGIDYRDIAVYNVAPVTTLTAPTKGSAIQSINVGTAVNDASTQDNLAHFTYLIDWGDGTAMTVPPSDWFKSSFSHVYTAEGTFVVKFYATDKDGGTSAASTRTVVISGIVAGAAIGDDPMDSSKTALYIGGTSGNDNISVSLSNGNLIPTIGGTKYGPAGGFSGITGRIYMLGFGGNDTLTLPATVPNAGVLLGGAGDDKLSATGSANMILVGGDGDDQLTSGAGRDILIGGLGKDKLSAGDGDDLLIGSATIYDAQLAKLGAIAKEWTSNNSYNDRIGHILGTQPNGNNGTTYLRPNIETTDDNAADSLTGGNGNDLWFASILGTKDVLSDYLSTETKITF